MSTVVITVASQQQQFPAGTVSAGIKVTLADVGSVVLTAAPYVATFENVPVGTHPITAEAIDAAGVVLGSSIVGSVTIEAPVVPTAPVEVTIDVPASLSVTVQ
jgi:hypothetical protein